MFISDSIYYKIIFECPAVPPESGGILGGTEGIITQYQFDPSMAVNAYDQYVPSVNKLNHRICGWQNCGIQFYGIYHSHFLGGTNLSNGDIKYINKIMLSMPAGVSTLFFPVVFPQKTMIAYRADRHGNCVHIVRDEIRIL